jgi:hypothetical protein
VDLAAELQRDHHGPHSRRDQRRHGYRVDRHLPARRPDPLEVLLQPPGDGPDRPRHHRQRDRRVHGVRQPGEQRGRPVLPRHRAAGHHRQPAVQLPVVGAQPDRVSAALTARRAARPSRSGGRTRQLSTGRPPSRTAATTARPARCSGSGPGPGRRPGS